MTKHIKAQSKQRLPSKNFDKHFDDIFGKTMDKEKSWICERIETSHTGRIIIKTNLINKYRKLINDFDSENWKIKDMMIREFNGYI